MNAVRLCRIRNDSVCASETDSVGETIMHKVIFLTLSHAEISRDNVA